MFIIFEKDKWNQTLILNFDDVSRFVLIQKEDGPEEMKVILKSGFDFLLKDPKDIQQIKNLVGC